MSGQPIEELFFGLRFNINTEALDEFQKKAESLKQIALNIGTVATVAAVSIGALVKSTADKLDDVGDFADLHGMSGQAVMAYQKIAKEHDSSAEAALSSIAGISSKLGEASLGIGRGALLFEKMEMSAKDAAGEVKGVDTILEEIAERMKKMSIPERLAFAEKLGIDKTFVNLLKDGAGALKAMREAALSAIPFSDEDFKTAGEAHELFKKAGGAATLLKDQVAVGLMPAVTEVLKGLVEWIKNARKATGTALTSAFKILGATVEMFGSVVMAAGDAVASFSKSLTNLNGILPVAGGALALVLTYKVGAWAIAASKALGVLATTLMTTGFAAALLPIALGALILLLGFLADDYMTYKNGGDSIIGRMLEEFPKLEKAFTNIGAVLSGWWSVNKTIFDAMYKVFSSLVDTVQALAKGLRELGSISIDSIKGLLTSPGMSRLATGFNDSAGTNAGTLPPLPGRGPMGDPFGRSSQSSTTSVMITAPITINSPDPKTAGQSVSDELQRQYRNGIRNGQSPIVN